MSTEAIWEVEKTILEILLSREVKTASSIQISKFMKMTKASKRSKTAPGTSIRRDSGDSCVSRTKVLQNICVVLELNSMEHCLRNQDKLMNSNG